MHRTGEWTVPSRILTSHMSNTATTRNESCWGYPPLPTKRGNRSPWQGLAWGAQIATKIRTISKGRDERCNIARNIASNNWQLNHGRCVRLKNIRELKQTRTATATRRARKRLFPYFWGLCNSAYFNLGSNFFCFCQSFYCFIVFNYGRAAVVISQNDAHVLTTTLEMKQLKSHVRHDGPEIMPISHIHVLLLSSAISLIV